MPIIFHCMDSNMINKKRILSLVSGLLLTAGSMPAFASAVANPLQNVSSLGDAYAGTATLSNDASSIYYNPAAMTMIPKRQLLIAGAGVIPSISFKGNYTLYAPIPQGSSDALLGSRTVNHSQGGFNGIIPSFYFAVPLRNRFTVGIGLTVPNGLGINYGQNSALKYTVYKGSLRNIDLIPALAFKVNPSWSVGAGLDLQYIDADLSMGIPQIIYTLNGPVISDTIAGNESNDFNGTALGYHLGVLWHNHSTRIGLAYHSASKFHLSGVNKIRFTKHPLVMPSATDPHTISSYDRTGAVQSDITLPWYINLSVHQQFGHYFSMMGTVIYEHWHGLNNINLQGEIEPSAFLHYPRMNISLYTGFKNTFTYSLATNYTPNEKWIFHLGAAYDQGSTNDERRQTWLPDADHYIVSTGVTRNLTSGPYH